MTAPPGERCNGGEFVIEVEEVTAQAQTRGFFGDASRGVLVEWIGLFWIERSEERKVEEASGVADAVEVGARECVLAVNRGPSCSPERSYLNGRQISSPSSVAGVPKFRAASVRVDANRAPGLADL